MTPTEEWLARSAARAGGRQRNADGWRRIGGGVAAASNDSTPLIEAEDDDKETPNVDD